MRNNVIKNEIDDFRKWEEKIKWRDVMYRASKHKYDFQKYEASSFGESIYTGKITIDRTEED